jgi:integrase/recombinase XerD
MGRRWPKKPLPESAKLPDGLCIWQRRYLEWLRVHHYSERTVINRDKSLGIFVEWCEVRGVLRPVEVTKPIIERYQRHLYYVRKPDGKPLSVRGQEWRLIPVRMYFKWLAQQNVLLWNPASEIVLPRKVRRLPKYVLSVSEVEQVLMQPNIEDVFGLRDRAILETFYATGMRRKELLGLKLNDIDYDRKVVMIREGKGGRDRFVPIGERALGWVSKYIQQARAELLVPPDEGALFLTRFGEAFHPAPLTHLVRQYVERAELGKTGACHLFRHTCATLMLEGGADIRYIQELLGHVLLSTTQIYTQVSIRRLCEVYAMTHPAAHLVSGEAKRKNGYTATNGTDSEPESSSDVESLFSRLAAEQDEDDESTAEDDCGE